MVLIFIALLSVICTQLWKVAVRIFLQCSAPNDQLCLEAAYTPHLMIVLMIIKFLAR